MNRLNVLISAHEFSPVQGSECGIGWNLVTRIAKYHNVTVLYARTNQFESSNYKQHIESYISKNGSIPGLTLIDISQPKIIKITNSLNKLLSKDRSIGFGPIYHFVYSLWQRKAYQIGKNLNKIHRFDIAHNITTIHFREPGYLWKLKIPFFWGPTGGTIRLNREFINSLSTKNKISEIIRNLSIKYQLKCSLKIKKAISSAQIIYAFSEEDKISLGKNAKGIVKVLLDTGTYIINNNNINKNPSLTLKAVWCGQFETRKAPEILLYAISESTVLKNNISFKLIGKGSLLNSIIALKENLELKNVEIINGVSHEEVFNIMSDSDIFVHTSYREATSAVIPEALSMGLPVICHDISGMSIAITEDCGIKVPVISPMESINGFKIALLKLLDNPELLNNLKNGAFKRANEISWDNNARTIAEDYNKIYENNRK